MSKTFDIGNSFNSETLAMGHAKKVWRRIDEQLPGGFHITNVSDFVDAGLIRSGMAVAYDTDQYADAKDIVVIGWDAIVSAQGVTYTLVADPSGNPKTKGYYEYDDTTHEYSATNDTSVTASKDYYEQNAAVTTDGLNIIGFLQEDVVIKDAYTYATGNVIVKGEIYGYMLGDTVTQASTIAPIIKAMTQKNGLSIRVVD